MQTGMTALLQGRMGGGMGAGMPDMMMRGGHGGGGLGNVISTVIIVLVVLWVVRNWSQITGWFNKALSSIKSGVTTVTTSVSSQSPLEIVQMRYAKGEISRDEYETLRRDLSGEGTPIPVTGTTVNG